MDAALVGKQSRRINIVDHASDNTIGRVLKKMRSSLISCSNGSSRRERAAHWRGDGGCSAVSKRRHIKITDGLPSVQTSRRVLADTTEKCRISVTKPLDEACRRLRRCTQMALQPVHEFARCSKLPLRRMRDHRSPTRKSSRKLEDLSANRSVPDTLSQASKSTRGPKLSEPGPTAEFQETDDVRRRRWRRSLPLPMATHRNQAGPAEPCQPGPRPDEAFFRIGGEGPRHWVGNAAARRGARMMKQMINPPI